TAGSVPAGSAPAPQSATPRAPARARKKAAVPSKVTVTLTSTGASWTVSATRGAKSVTRSTPVPPGVVTAVASLLDQPPITEAVAEVNETALAEAQERAAELRAELAALDAVLAAHRAPA
ncbi:MAG: hypothetical protein JWO63_1761, partial [Frankiales bacterium]|nr:hypothetical protein [Frankiales bacterium]